MTTKRKDGVGIFPSTDDTNDETITSPSPYEDKTLDILFSTVKQSTGIAGEDASPLLYETNTTPETSYGNSATQEAYSTINARKTTTAFPDIIRNPTGDSTGKSISKHKSNSSKEENSFNNMIKTITVQPSSGSLSDINAFMPFTTPAKSSRRSSHRTTPEYGSSTTKQTYFTDDKTIVPTLPNMFSDYNDAIGVTTTAKYFSTKDDVIATMAIPRTTLPNYEEASSSTNRKSSILQTPFTNAMTTELNDGADIFDSTNDSKDETITTPSPDEDYPRDILSSTVKPSSRTAGEDASPLFYGTNTTPEMSKRIYAVMSDSDYDFGSETTTSHHSDEGDVIATMAIPHTTLPDHEEASTLMIGKSLSLKTLFTDVMTTKLKNADIFDSIDNIKDETITTPSPDEDETLEILFSTVKQSRGIAGDEASPLLYETTTTPDTSTGIYAVKQSNSLLYGEDASTTPSYEMYTAPETDVTKTLSSSIIFGSVSSDSMGDGRETDATTELDDGTLIKNVFTTPSTQSGRIFNTISPVYGNTATQIAHSTIKAKTFDVGTPTRNTKRFNTYTERLDPSEILEGQPIMIYCVVRNLTFTNVSWITNCVSLTHKYGLSIPWPTDKGYVIQIETRDNGRRLFNISLSQTDNGIYKCVSENPAFLDEVTTTGVRGRGPIFGQRTRNIRAKPPGFRAGRPNIPVRKPYNNPAREPSHPKRSGPRTPMVTIEVYMVNKNDSSVPLNNLRLAQINCSTAITSEPMDNVENETILTLSPNKDTSLINVATPTVKPNMGLLVVESSSTPRFKMATTQETDSSDEKVITSTRTAAPPSYEMSTAPETDLTDTLSSSTIFGSVSSDSMGDSKETNAAHEADDGNSMKNVLTTPSTLSSKVFNSTSTVYGNSATHEAYSTIKAKTTATAFSDIIRNPTRDSTGKRVSKHKSNSSKEENSLNNVFGTTTVQPSSGSLSDTNAFMPFTTPAKPSRGSSHHMMSEYESSTTKQTYFTDDKTIVPTFPNMFSDYNDAFEVETTAKYLSTKDDVIATMAIPRTTLPNYEEASSSTNRKSFSLQTPFTNAMTTELNDGADIFDSTNDSKDETITTPSPDEDYPRDILSSTVKPSSRTAGEDASPLFYGTNTTPEMSKRIYAVMSDSDYDFGSETTTSHHSDEGDVIATMAIPHTTLPDHEEASTLMIGKSLSLKTLFTDVMTTKLKNADIFDSIDNIKDETITTPSPDEDETLEILFSTVKQSRGIAGDEASPLLYETTTTPDTSTGIYAVKQSNSLLYGEDASTTPSYEMYTAPETDVTKTLSSSIIFGSVSSDSMGDGRETDTTTELDDGTLIKNVFTTPSTQSGRIFNTISLVYGNTATQIAHSTIKAKTFDVGTPTRNTKRFNTYTERLDPSEILEGQPIMIYCVVRNLTFTNVSWIRNCVSLTHKYGLSIPWPTDKGYVIQIETRDNGRRLFNISLSQTDNGIYKCVSENPAFLDEVTTTGVRGRGPIFGQRTRNIRAKPPGFRAGRPNIPVRKPYNNPAREPSHPKRSGPRTPMVTIEVYMVNKNDSSVPLNSLRLAKINCSTAITSEPMDNVENETISTLSPNKDTSLINVATPTVKLNMGLLVVESSSTPRFKMATTQETDSSDEKVIISTRTTATPSYEMSTAPETDLTDTLSSSTIFGSVSSESMGDGTETNATHKSDDGNSIKNLLTTPTTQSSRVFNTTSPVYGNSATQEAYSTLKAKTTATAIPDIIRNLTGDSTGKSVSKHKSNSLKEENFLNIVFGTITVQTSSGSLSDANAFMPFTTPAKPLRGSSHDMMPEYESLNTKQTYFTYDKTIVPTFSDMISDYSDHLIVETTTKHHSNEDDVITRIAMPHTTLPDYENASTSINGKSFSLKTLFTDVMTTKQKDGVDISPSTDDNNDETITTPSPDEDYPRDILSSTVKQSSRTAGEDAMTLLYETGTTPKTDFTDIKATSFINSTVTSGSKSGNDETFTTSKNVLTATIRPSSVSKHASTPMNGKVSTLKLVLNDGTTSPSVSTLVFDATGDSKDERDMMGHTDNMDTTTTKPSDGPLRPTNATMKVSSPTSTSSSGLPNSDVSNHTKTNTMDTNVNSHTHDKTTSQGTYPVVSDSTDDVNDGTVTNSTHDQENGTTNELTDAAKSPIEFSGREDATTADHDNTTTPYTLQSEPSGHHTDGKTTSTERDSVGGFPISSSTTSNRIYAESDADVESVSEDLPVAYSNAFVISFSIPILFSSVLVLIV